MKQQLTEQRLVQENDCFSNTAGVSGNNHSLVFLPAFRDGGTGDIYLSRFVDGRRAPVHLLEGLPDEVVIQRTAAGDIRAIKSSVVSGFVHKGRFYTRAEAARVSGRRH